MASDNPTTTLTVPAKPAAITAVNVAALAGTAAAVTGPIGWAVAGAIAAAPMVVHGIRRASGKRRTRTTKTTTSRVAGGKMRMPSLGRAASGASGRGRAAARQLSSLGRAAGRLGVPTPRGSRKAESRTGSSAPSGRSGAHRRPDLLRRLFGSSSATPGNRTAGRASSGRAAGARRIARASARHAAGFARGLATRSKPKTTASQAYKVNRDRGIATALGSATRVGARRTWRQLGKWFRRWVLGRKPKKKTKQALLKQVSPIVDRGDIGTATQFPDSTTRTPQSAPGEPIRPGATQPPKEHTMSNMDTPSGIRETAGRMWANADAWTPRGMLTVVEEYHDLPKTLEFMRATVGALMDKSMKKFPVDPAIAQQIGKVVECLDTAATMARKVPEAVETIHKHDLDRLRRPRVGEGMWDRVANGVG